MIPAVLFGVGCVFVAFAIRAERLMHRHRVPGVSYADATFRRDGGWRRTDLFSPEGLAHQQRAAKYAFLGVACWVAALGAFLLLAR
jgi:hypothetical protein